MTAQNTRAILIHGFSHHEGLWIPAGTECIVELDYRLTDPTEKYLDISATIDGVEVLFWVRPNEIKENYHESAQEIFAEALAEEAREGGTFDRDGFDSFCPEESNEAIRDAWDLYCSHLRGE